MLDEDGVEFEDISIRLPTLDDVFLTLTGRPPEEAAEDGAVPIPKTKSRGGAMTHFALPWPTRS